MQEIKQSIKNQYDKKKQIINNLPKKPTNSISVCTTIIN